MSSVITMQDKPRRRWLIPAIASITALVAGVFGNIIAPKIEKIIGSNYLWIIWLIFGIASVVTIIMAINDARRKKDSLPSTDSNQLNVHGNFSVGGNFVGRDQNIAADIVGRDRITNITANIYEPFSYHPGSAPPLPQLIIGRENDLHDLKTRLKAASTSVQVLTAVRGWPGVGKTTIASAIAHDADIVATFPDGVLWVSLGQNPVLLSELAEWGRALGVDSLLKVKNVEEASMKLSSFLRNKRMLLIVDDVWESEHAIPFIIGGRRCAMLITTRITKVAENLAPTPNDIYKLDVLSVDKSIELLQKLAPSVVLQNYTQCLELVQELEGLPLALQVAGRLLNTEANRGFSVNELLSELRQGAKLLTAQAPVSYINLIKQITPTVAALLQKSTQFLEEHTRKCFAYLGVFAPKPATFDLAAMKAVWQVDDPKPIVIQLVDRGLLEFVNEIKRYQMHALMVLYARSLLTE